ncbi:MAG: hypothetical protein RR290_03710 [Clostridia bacterium]
MKMLSTEVRNLIDKLYNLRGEDSVILTKMNNERQEAIETQERTKSEKEVLLSEIEKLTKDESLLAEQGNKLMNILGSIDRNDFAIVLDRLNINFNPEELNEKVSSLLPGTMEKIVSEHKVATEKLTSVENEMTNALTKIEELGIRKDEVLSNQAKLNEYFELALNGNINITRDAITNLLEKFDFNENEQREAAKVLMFPEDALYEYDASLKSGEKVSGKTITEVLAEAKGSVVEETLNEEPSAELTDIFEKVIEENTFEARKEEVVEKVPLEPKETEKEKLINVLKSVGLDADAFTVKSFTKLMENYDEETLKQNVEVLNNKGIDLDIIKENYELLYDKELKEKVEKLMGIGKEPKDICLMPGVLVKYDLNGLNNTINVLQISGLDPKKVPLMAY